MRRIGVVFPELGCAGPDMVAAWVVEALADQHEVTFITTRVPDWQSCNRFFGTHLGGDVRVKVVGIPSWLSKTHRLRGLKQHLLMRYCKANVSAYDLYISAYNEMDFGCAGIQYIHYPNVEDEASVLLDKWYYRRSLIREFYHEAGRMLSHYSPSGMVKNLTLVNSEWTKRVVDSLYGIDSRVVYPPVWGCPGALSWEEKENGFVFIGRIAPDKRPLEVLRVLADVRRQGHDVHVHLVGNEGMDGAYTAAVRDFSVNNSDWAFCEGNVERRRLDELVAGHRYGINGKKHEHFGIGNAEMLRGGCIVFVNDGGGQVDIVGRDENLVYHSDADAVQKIARICGDEALQRRIREKLRIRGQQYSTDRFSAEMRRAVLEQLSAGNAVA